MPRRAFISSPNERVFHSNTRKWSCLITEFLKIIIFVSSVRCNTKNITDSAKELKKKPGGVIRFSDTVQMITAPWSLYRVAVFCGKSYFITPRITHGYAWILTLPHFCATIKQSCYRLFVSEKITMFCISDNEGRVIRKKSAYHSRRKRSEYTMSDMFSNKKQDDK